MQPRLQGINEELRQLQDEIEQIRPHIRETIAEKQARERAEAQEKERREIEKESQRKVRLLQSKRTPQVGLKGKSAVAIDDFVSQPVKVRRIQPTAGPDAPKKWYETQKGKLAIGGAGVVALMAAGYAGLKYWEKRRIKTVLKSYDIDFDQLTQRQKDLLAGTLKAAYGVSWPLRRFLQKHETDSVVFAIPHVWELLAELYYKVKPTSEQVDMLTSRIKAGFPAQGSSWWQQFKSRVGF